MRSNVLYIIWSLGLGGAEQVVISLAQGLDKNKFQSFICCLDDEGVFVDGLKSQGIEIFALNKKRGIDLSVIFKIKRIIKENQIHVVHTHLWGAGLWGRIAALLAGVPVVITEHNVDVWKKWYHKLSDKVLALFTKKICAVSNKVKEFYVRNVGISEKKIEVVYNGINPDPPMASQDEIDVIKQELGIVHGVPVIANIGRLVPAKANHIFIEALRILDQKDIVFHSLIIGDGLLKQSLMDASVDLIDKGRLTFAGLRKDVSKILDLTDISVLSSTREGFSIVVLESMAKGVPFVATDVGGNDEQIIDGKTGFLVPCGDAQALAEGMAKILDNPSLASDMGHAAKQRIQDEFSLEGMVKKMQEVYELVNDEGKNG